MRKRILAAAMAGALLMGSMTAYAYDFENSDKVIFGCLTYLTGDSMEQGERSKAIVDYAVDQVNANGGVLGKTLEVQYFDSGNDQQTVLNSVQKILTTEGMSGFFGCMFSSDTIAYMPNLIEAQMPSITAGNSANVLAEGNDYIWMPREADDMVAQALAKMAIGELGMKNPAIIYMNNSSGQSVHDNAKKVLDEAGIETAIEISYDPTNTSNYAPIATQLMNSGADGLILAANSADSSGILSTQAIQQVGFDGPKVTVPALFRLDTIEQAGGALEGWYGLAEFNVNSDDELVSKVVADFRELHPDMDPTWIEAVFYDSLMMFVEACNIAGSTEPAKINEAMKELKGYKGMMGTHSYYENHSTPDGIYMAHIENGEIVFDDYMTR
ncbi:MAG: ABC transporter substrate-binding protein [Lachnospiraceae bacterium]|nr:ABC transporter substrate-binding protein [Lachnospiraceae bacterium]